MTMRTQKPGVAELLRRCDTESGGERIGFFVTLDAAERELLKTAAGEARTSQMGIMRIGLRIAAQAILALQD